MSSRIPSQSAHRKALLQSHAASMRHSPTLSEQLLWSALRGSQLGVPFRRQVPMGPYIADFLAPSIRLVVEVDGGYHALVAHRDSRRDSRLLRWGYRVLRLSEQEVLQELPRAIQRIRQAILAAQASG